MTIPVRRQVTTSQLSHLLLQTVIEPGAGEAQAVHALSEPLGVTPEELQVELLYTRAFAVELALQVGLGGSDVEDRLRDEYVASLRQVDEDAWEMMQERLETYRAFTEQAEGTTGLAGTMGGCFAAIFEQGPLTADLAHLGGRLFTALFDEISQLLTQIDLIDSEAESDQGQMPD
jgi:hypothetical protein